MCSKLLGRVDNKINCIPHWEGPFSVSKYFVRQIIVNENLDFSMPLE